MAVNGTNVALPPINGEPYAEIALTGVTSTLLCGMGLETDTVEPVLAGLLADWVGGFLGCSKHSNGNCLYVLYLLKDVLMVIPKRDLVSGWQM